MQHSGDRPRAAARAGVVAFLVGALTLSFPQHQVAEAAPSSRFAKIGLEAVPTRSRPLMTTQTLPWRANLVGVSWVSGDDEAEGVAARLRARHVRDGWSGWVDLDVEGEHGPDPGTEPRALDRVFADPVWVGTADAVQVRIERSARSIRIADVRIEAVNSLGDAEPLGLAERLGRAVGRVLTATPAEASPRVPRIISRAGWGADESLTSSGPGVASELKMAFVHHTVNSNSYSRSEAPALVRGIYSYHTKGRGYSDIAYNFLVDRYGKVYEGRKGGVKEAVIGAHVGGFNTYSTGIALIGDFTSSSAPSRMVDALVELLAWKLDVHHVPPTGRVRMTAQSDGSRYDEGESVRLARISGHRHASLTSCPGSSVAQLLSRVRERVDRTGHPKIYRPRLSTTTLRPNGDGVDDVVTFRASFSKKVDWVWRVKDATGETVFSRSGRGTSVTRTFKGVDGEGAQVPSGPYAWVLTARRVSSGAAARRATGELELLAPSARGCGGCVTVAPGADFNGDGFADLAIGVPGEDTRGGVDTGAVNVLYGSTEGLTGADDDLLTEDAIGLDASEPGDRFGSALAAGDFNGDGFADLAVAAPREGAHGARDAGAVTIVFGSADGLDTSTAQHLDGFGPDPGSSDTFGASLAAGDFNGDGIDDLLVGVPGRSGGVDRPRAGLVAAFRGRPSGLEVSATFVQGVGGVWGTRQRDDRFGASLTSGDVDGDGRDDAIVGAPGEGINRQAGAGALVVLFGANGGLTATGSQVWHQGVEGSVDEPEHDDQAGFALAAGDLDGDGDADVAIGIPGEELAAGPNDHGVVTVLRGTNAGLNLDVPTTWHPGLDELPGEASAGDMFGASLVAADFNGDGRSDLAAGAPGDDVNDVVDAGSVTVLMGSDGGLVALGSQRWTQASTSINGQPGLGDAFGMSVAAGDFNGDGPAELVSGVPGEDIGGAPDAGAVSVIAGSLDGLTYVGDRLWHQDSAGVRNRAEPGDLFGTL